VIGAIMDKDVQDLDRRVRGIRDLLGAGGSKGSTDGRIVEKLRALRPEVFWAVAPGHGEALDVVEDGDGLQLRPRDDLPRRPK
jgi:hypothetical protein